jgi:threonine/homoserine/homoserine lactone efflux protein
VGLPALATLIAFAAAMVPVVVTPGASFALATTQALAGNVRGVRTVVLGTGLGIFTHAGLAAAGLSALVMRSATAYEVVRFVGALFLIGLGLITLWRSRTRSAPVANGRLGPVTLRSAWTANVLNPKAAAVYLTLAPQFLSRDAIGLPGLLALAAVHVTLTAVWLIMSTGVLRLVTANSRGPALTRSVSAIGGAVLIALGIRTLIQARV